MPLAAHIMLGLHLRKFNVQKRMLKLTELMVNDGYDKPPFKDWPRLFIASCMVMACIIYEGITPTMKTFLDLTSLPELPLRSILLPASKGYFIAPDGFVDSEGRRYQCKVSTREIIRVTSRRWNSSWVRAEANSGHS